MLETSGCGDNNFRTLKFDGYLQIFFGKLKFSLVGKIFLGCPIKSPEKYQICYPNTRHF